MVAPDKITHAQVCALIVIATVGIFFESCGWWALVLGLVGAVAAGIMKEKYDSRPGGTGWDWNDIKADTVGIVIGEIIGVLIVVFA